MIYSNWPSTAAQLTSGNGWPGSIMPQEKALEGKQGTTDSHLLSRCIIISLWASFSPWSSRKRTPASYLPCVVVLRVVGKAGWEFRTLTVARMQNKWNAKSQWTLWIEMCCLRLFLMHCLYMMFWLVTREPLDTKYSTKLGCDRPSSRALEVRAEEEIHAGDCLLLGTLSFQSVRGTEHPLMFQQRQLMAACLNWAGSNVHRQPFPVDLTRRPNQHSKEERAVLRATGSHKWDVSG